MGHSSVGRLAAGLCRRGAVAFRVVDFFHVH
jgi:hypothetical protein